MAILNDFASFDATGRTLKTTTVRTDFGAFFKLLPEKWKAVEASAVAMAMLKSARNPPPYRLQIIESEQIQKYA